MSYDLMVFDPAIAPREREAFMDWYREVTQWGEDRDYNSPEGVSGNLRAFYDAMREFYPAMNGPDAYDFDAAPAPAPAAPKQGFWGKLFGAKPAPVVSKPPFNEAFVTDYSIANHAIYMAFAWSIAELAYSDVITTAMKTGVGVFDVSANNGAILHDPEQLSQIEIL